MYRFLTILSISSMMIIISLAQVLNDTTQWTHHAILDNEGKVELFWTPGVEDIIFEVHAETKGYIAIGFSPSGGMINADIVVGWVINNAPTLQDRFSKDNVEPTIDTEQNYKLLGGYETDTKTVLKFQRSYDTCDPHDWRITNDTTFVIYAYHPDDPVGNTLAVHTRAGHRSLYLAGFNHPLPEAVPNSKSVEMRMSNVGLPMGEKSFCWEKVFKITSSPSESIIGYKPVWNNLTAPAIDLMRLYQCDVTRDALTWDKYSNTNGARCDASTLGIGYANCTKILASATAGSLGYMLPSTVGLSFKDSSSVYFLLRVEYSGWKNQENLIDDSGFRVIFTTNPVPNQAGSLTVGHHLGVSQIVPIDQKDFTTLGFCDSECTGTSLPPEGIFIYEVFLYSKHFGRKMTLKHLRKGEELEPLAKDEHYKGNVQVYRSFLSPIHMLPGDNLVLDCRYDTTEAQSTILGGVLPDNETCLAFLNYYPRVELQTCLSSPPLTQLFQWLDTKQVEVEPSKYSEVSPDGQDPRLAQFLKHYNWASRATEFQKFVRDSYTSICTYEMRNDTVSGIRIPPRIESPFYQHSKCGDGPTNASIPGPMEPSGTDMGHDHSGHDHSGHDHSGHDHPGSDTGMPDQPVDGSMSSEHPNEIDGSTHMPDHAKPSKPQGNSSTILISSNFSLILTVLLLVINRQ